MSDHNNERFFEFGIESPDPLDDFARWETEKKREHAGRRLVQIVRQGLVNMEK